MTIQVTEHAENILRESVSNFAGITEQGCLLRWGDPSAVETPVFEVIYKGTDPSTLKLLEACLSSSYEKACKQLAPS
ncbi:MAG: hypothetical protein VKK59_04130 [Vampirovibrionales bacterium]|nr:hypothetical protein [Vampirovibrionales bacterium]